MSKTNDTTLNNLVSNHTQFCLGLKSLIDGGCSTEALNPVIEELCDQAESINSKVMN